MMDGYWGNWNWMWGWSLVGMLWMVFFLGVIIVGIVLIVRWIADGGGRRRNSAGGGGAAGTGSGQWRQQDHGFEAHGAGPVETAMDILKKRYARGEITKEEFDRMKEDLKD